VKKAGYSLISIDNNDVAPKVIKMITANFIEVNKLYNFCMSDGLKFCLFVIKFDAEISAQSLLLKIKSKSIKHCFYILIIV